MSDALHWLIGEKENGEQNNSSPKHLKIDNKNLAALPDRGVTRVECQVVHVQMANKTKM